MGRYIDTGKITYMWQKYKDGEYTEWISFEEEWNRYLKENEYED